MTIREQLVEYFKKNPAPGDGDIHAMAESLGLSSEAFEAEIYKLLHDVLVTDGAATASVKEVVTASLKRSIQTAAPINAYRHEILSVVNKYIKKEPLGPNDEDFAFSSKKVATQIIDELLKRGYKKKSYSGDDCYVKGSMKNAITIGNSADGDDAGSDTEYEYAWPSHSV